MAEALLEPIIEWIRTQIKWSAKGLLIPGGMPDPRAEKLMVYFLENLKEIKEFTPALDHSSEICEHVLEDELFLLKTMRQERPGTYIKMIGERKQWAVPVDPRAPPRCWPCRARTASPKSIG